MRTVKPSIHVTPSLGDSIFDTFLTALTISIEHPQSYVHSNGQSENEEVKFKNGEIVKGRDIFEEYRSYYKKGIEDTIMEMKKFQ